MNTELELSAHQLHLAIAPRALMTSSMSALIARLGMRSAIQVLDGGNCFDAYRIAQLVHQQAAYGEAPDGTPTDRAAEALERIRVARAFTCYQMEALLVTALRAAQALPPGTPVVVLNLLDTFSDESTSASERMRLLEHCLELLRRLALQAPVLVSVHLHHNRRNYYSAWQTPSQPDELLKPDVFLRRLEESAHQVWRFEEPDARPAQIRLF